MGGAVGAVRNTEKPVSDKTKGRRMQTPAQVWERLRAPPIVATGNAPLSNISTRGLTSVLFCSCFLHICPGCLAPGFR